MAVRRDLDSDNCTFPVAPTLPDDSRDDVRPIKLPPVGRFRHLLSLVVRTAVPQVAGRTISESTYSKFEGCPTPRPLMRSRNSLNVTA